MGCAECHDHKFDPITQRDFYAMAAFFADVQEVAVGRREPGMPVPTADDERELARQDQVTADRRAVLDRDVATLLASTESWEQELLKELNWSVLTPVETNVLGESQLKRLDDGSLKSTGTSAATETYVITFEAASKEADSAKWNGLRLEVLADDELPEKGPGLAPNGNFVLTEFKVARIGADGKPVAVKVTHAVADHSQSGHDIGTAIDGKDNTGWALLPQIGQSHEAVFALQQPVGGGDAGKPNAASSRFVVTLEFKSQFAQHWPASIEWHECRAAHVAYRSRGGARSTRQSSRSTQRRRAATAHRVSARSIGPIPSATRGGASGSSRT